MAFSFQGLTQFCKWQTEHDSVIQKGMGRVQSLKAGTLAFVGGLFVLLAYWYSVHPMDFARGYTEDWCHPEQTRQLMAEALERAGGPSFRTHSFSAPTGISLPFMSWGIQISWLGAYFWSWNRDFPFLWALFGFSLLISYVGVGWILRKMSLVPVAAWGLALSVVLLHVPRHFKVWHHYEHLLDHWVYFSFFLDAWIWQRFWRERRFSWSLEAWRALCLCGMMTAAGYFWGPLILLWLLVRLCMAGVWLGRRKRDPDSAILVEGAWRQALPAVAIGLVFIVIELRWFLPLAREVKGVGSIWQGLGWFGHWPYLLRPFWLEDVFKTLKPFASFETVITPGWFFWVPLITGLIFLGRRALLAVLPFALLLFIAIAYLDENLIRALAPAIQRTIPFMGFFRVASRWGLFLPALLGSMIALCWPELSRGVAQLYRRKPVLAATLLVLFAISTGFEALRLRTPFSTMPALSEPAARLLEEVRVSPGTTVLDLPFCLAGGNGVCTQESCPNYPMSTTGACFHGWHDKRVYGIYASRLASDQCKVYQSAPYTSWFDAWRSQRCFTDTEWTEFCAYLDHHPEHSAVLLYPDIWTGAGSPECLAKFTEHLGKPQNEAQFASAPVRGDETPRMSRLLRFAPRCVR